MYSYLNVPHYPLGRWVAGNICIILDVLLLSMKKSPLKRTAWRKKPSRKAQKPHKAKSLSKLKKELWKWFSLFIRQRDKFTCFTCGRKGIGSAIHAGHFIAKSVGGIGLYFDEDNVHAQCYHCNINLGGNQYEYALRLGEMAKWLYNKKNGYMKVDEDWYREKIAHYKSKVYN